MTNQPKISPFQLTCMLLAGRMFVVLIWSPRGETEAGSLLWAAAVAAAGQFLLLLPLLWLAERSRFPGRLGQLLGVVFFLWAAASTAVSCARFLSRSFYDGRWFLLFTALLLGAGGLAAVQGLEALARVAPAAVLLAGLGLLLLGTGAAGGARLDYLPPLVTTPVGTARLAISGTLAHWELAALFFLQPYAVRPLKKRAIAFWLGAGGVLSAAVSLLIMLTLGYYAAGVEYPVLAVARCAQLLLMPRPDPLLMGMWVLLGFVRISGFLFLARALWQRLAPGAFRGARRAGTAALLLCVLLLSGCARGEESIGAKTLVTLLEVAPENGCTVWAEYRLVGGERDEEPQYGVHSGTGETLEAALENLSRENSARLFLESCRVVVVRGTEADTAGATLEALGAVRGLRPLTAVFLCGEPMVAAERPEIASMGRAMEKLFIKNGGRLPERYTLKDSLATLRDPRLTLELPVVELGKDSVRLVKISDAFGYKKG